MNRPCMGLGDMGDADGAYATEDHTAAPQPVERNAIPCLASGTYCSSALQTFAMPPVKQILQYDLTKSLIIRTILLGFSLRV
jgi:hypothetical protein